MVSAFSFISENVQVAKGKKTGLSDFHSASLDFSYSIEKSSSDVSSMNKNAAVI